MNVYACVEALKLLLYLNKKFNNLLITLNEISNFFAFYKVISNYLISCMSLKEIECDEQLLYMLCCFSNY